MVRRMTIELQGVGDDASENVLSVLLVGERHQCASVLLTPVVDDAPGDVGVRLTRLLP